MPKITPFLWFDASGAAVPAGGDRTPNPRPLTLLAADALTAGALTGSSWAIDSRERHDRRRQRVVWYVTQPPRRRVPTASCRYHSRP